MPAPKSQRGSRAEDAALDFLTEQGYRLVARNHRCRQGEVDLIAYDGEVLCFIEVRSLATDAQVHPLETIGPAKIRRIVAAARDFLESLPSPWPPMRFDAVGVVTGESVRFELVREAFEA